MATKKKSSSKTKLEVSNSNKSNMSFVKSLNAIGFVVSIIGLVNSLYYKEDDWFYFLILLIVTLFTVICPDNFKK